MRDGSGWALVFVALAVLFWRERRRDDLGRSPIVDRAFDHGD